MKPSVATLPSQAASTSSASTPLGRLAKGGPSLFSGSVRPAAVSAAALSAVLLSGRVARVARVARRPRGLKAQAAAASLILDDGWDDEPEANEQVPLSKRAPLLIDGRIIIPPKSFRVTNASADMIEAAVTAAHRAAPGWAQLRHTERASVLMSCADTLRSNLEALATLQTNESGRPISETRIEVMVAAATFENAARHRATEI
eukprot:g15531.t1